MRKKSTHQGRQLPVLLLAMLVTGSAFAQPDLTRQVRSLVIKDNQVLIDGKLVQQTDLPENLELGDDVQVSYSFVGMDIPVVTIGPNLFAMERDRLVFVGPASQIPKWEFRRKRLDKKDARGFIIDSEQGQYFTFEGELLAPKEAVPRLLEEAENLYLQGLQERDQGLFSQLARERSMDLDVRDLVREIRSTTDVSDRKELTEQLRTRLEEIFELKQANRRAEIEDMETRLKKLQSHVAQRQKQRDLIIEQRINELLGEHSMQP
jgi:hypothetical protein